MAELRRKLVVVGDGACGMCFYLFPHYAIGPSVVVLVTPSHLPLSDPRALRENLSYDRIFEGEIPSRVYSDCI